MVTHFLVPLKLTDDYSYMKKLCKQKYETATYGNEWRLQFRNERQSEDMFDQFYECLLRAASKVYTDMVDEPHMDANFCNQFIFGFKDTSIKQK